MWLTAWCELAEQHGLDLLRASLTRHCRTQRYLPLPADVREGIEAVKEERRAAAAVDAETVWSIDRYRQMQEFDLYLSEQVAAGKTREEILRRFPGMGPSWALWSNQRAAGVIRCPGWCDTCAGDRFLIVEKDGRRAAHRCPDCQGINAKQPERSEAAA